MSKFIEAAIELIMLKVFVQTIRVSQVLYCPQMKRKLKAADSDAWPGFMYSVELQNKNPVFRIDMRYFLV